MTLDARLRAAANIGGLAVAMYLASRFAFALPEVLHVAGGVVSPNGLALAWLLLSPRRHAWGLIAASAAGMGAAELALGGSLAVTASFGLLAGGGLAGFYFLIRRLFPDGFSICRPRALVAYYLIAAPASLAFAGVLSAVFNGGAPTSPPVMLNWTLAELVGFTVLTPGILGLKQFGELLAGRRCTPLGGAGMIAAVGIAAIVMFQDRYPMLFLIPTLLLLASAGLEVFGAAIGVLAISALAGVSAALGVGPTSLMHASELEQLMVLQVFMVAVSTASFGMAVTMAERRRAARSLFEGAQRASMAESLAGLAHWRMEFPSRTTTWSPGMYAIFGMDPALPIDLEASLEMIHPEDRSRFHGLIQRQLEGETIGAAESARRSPTRVIRRDGTMRYITGRMVTERAPDGSALAIFGTLIDVTELHAANLAAGESEARFQLIADNSSDMTVRVSPDGELIYISPSVERILGCTPAVALASGAGQLHPDDEKRFFETFRKVCAGELPPGTPLRHRRQHVDGHYVWLEAAPSPIFGATGELIEVIDVIRDITVQKALEDELADAKAVAEQAAEVKSQFLANMSHELRTPLTAVLGFARLIEGQAELAEATRGYARRLNTAGAALHSIINDVLDFTRLEVGQVELNRRPAAPAEFLNETVDTLAFAAESKGLAIRRTGFERLPDSIEIDPERLRQVLLNLIGNAVKFTDAGEVEVSAKYLRGGRLEVVVSDTGPGIARRERSRLFQRFSQIDGSATRRHGGSGLGLAICKGIVESMGGAIGLRSRPGHGASFWIRIPAPRVCAVAAGHAEPAAEPLRPGLKVLVVDDHAVNRQLARAILEAFQVQVSEAAGGREAIAAAAAEAFDVILMDVRMPEVDGMSAMRAIRNGRGPNRDGAILAFSAEGGDWAMARLDAGFDGHVAKPMTLEALTSAVAMASRLQRGGIEPSNENGGPEDRTAINS